MKVQFGVSIIGVAVSIAAPAAASPFDGTWKVDLKTAHFSEKPDFFSIAGGLYTCASCVPPVSVQADGAFHPTPGQVDYDEVSVKVVDANTIARSRKFHGKLMMEGTDTLSADGKTLEYRWTDFSAPVSPPPVYHGTEVRVGAAPAGAHAISGSWKLEQGTAQASDAALTMMLKLEGNGVSMSVPTGFSYVAPLDGTHVPVKGDPVGSTVSLKATAPGTLVETDYVGAKVTSVVTMTLSADGKTMTMISDDPIRKTSSTFTFDKQ